MKAGITAVLVLITSIVFAFAQQQPEKKGTIEGVVLSAATGAPIAGAQVYSDIWFDNAASFWSDSPPRLYAPPDAVTGNDGRFVLSVRDGRYRVFASADGHVRWEYGQKIPHSIGARIDVSPNQTVKDLVLRLPQAAVVSGRVVDENRQPAVGVSVRILRAVYTREDGRSLRSAQTTVANDRGEYRLYGLTPGRYYLVAGPTPDEAMSPVLPLGNYNPAKYAPTYYPGVSDLSQATFFDVKPPSETTIDLTVKPSRSYSIRGRLVDSSTGKPPATPFLSLTMKTPEGQSIGLAQVRNYDATTGNFEMSSVVPGLYGLRATPTPPTTARIAATAPMGTAVVNVVDADVENVQIVISSGTTLRARIQRDGEQIPEHFLFRILVTPVVGSGPTNPIEPDIAEDGLFSLPNMRTGEYRVEVTGMVYGFTVKSIRYAGTEVLGRTMKFSEASSETLEILVRRSTSEITGSVTDNAQRAAPRAEIVLVPEDRSRRDLFYVVHANDLGNFSIERVAPGQYKAFSWEAIEPLAYYDPEFVRRYEQYGRPVTVNEGASSTVDVRMIPVEP
jgi:hypothetical protein